MPRSAWHSAALPSGIGRSIRKGFYYPTGLVPDVNYFFPPCCDCRRAGLEDEDLEEQAANFAPQPRYANCTASAQPASHHPLQLPALHS